MYNLTYLAHHGIIGQRWGVRRFQYEDGSLTDAGRRRYSTNVSGAKAAYKTAKTKYNYALNYQYGNASAIKDAKNKLYIAKKNLDDEKAKEGLNKEADKGKQKSKHRLQLEEEYKKQGLTDEEAEIQAYKRAKTEKVLAVTAGVTLAAVAAYSGYKLYDKNVDRLIKPGMTMNNISKFNNKGVEDAFYAASNPLDKIKYRGIYGDQIINGEKVKDVYDTTFKATKNIKVASENSGKKALKNLIDKDPEYRKNLEKYLSNVALDSRNGPIVNNVAAKGVNDLRKGKVSGKVYNAVNTMLVARDDTGNKLKDKFYGELKKRGYSGVADIHDRKNSGYKSINPYIIFDGKGKAKVDSVKKLSDSTIKRDKGAGYGMIMAQTYAPAIAVGAVSKTVISKGKQYVQQMNDNKIVSNYRKEHPNTKLTYNEILENERS